MTALDHMVLAVGDLDASLDFYRQALGVRPTEVEPGRWALRLGSQLVVLRTARGLPAIAFRTTPGSANFCLLTDVPIADVVAHLSELGVAVVEGPVERLGAVGPMMSVYFHDPDGNLVEVAQPI